MNEQSTSPGAERGIFLKLFETYNYLPITTDSHLGEYLSGLIVLLIIMRY